MFSRTSISSAIFSSILAYLPVYAEFTTVIDIPPNPIPSIIHSDTQINVGDGGSLGTNFRVGSSFVRRSNIEVNIRGGYVGDNFRASGGSTINISGGYLHSGVYAVGGAVINVSGGILNHGFEIDSGVMNLYGGDYLLDGQPIASLLEKGSQERIDFFHDSYLSGVLADGTPFVFKGLWDQFPFRSLSLHTVELPQIEPFDDLASAGSSTIILRKDQALTVDIPVNRIQAGQESIVSVVDGGIANVEAIGAEINVFAGELRGRVFEDSKVNVFGGKLGNFFNVHNNSTVNFYDGEIGYEATMHGGVVNIFDGVIDRKFSVLEGELNLFGGRFTDYIDVGEGAVINIAGGTMHYGGPSVYGGTANFSSGALKFLSAGNEGSKLNLSGGQISDGLRAGAGTEVSLIGGEFSIDGENVGGADAVGESIEINLPEGAVLSGTYKDGSRFSFSSTDRTRVHRTAVWDSFEQATIILKRVSLPPIASTEITASTNAIPLGVRTGQTLRVSAGETIGDQFGASPESTVIIEAGGTMGNDFEPSGAKVKLNGGTIGFGLDVSSGSTIDMHGGEIGGIMDVFRGGTVSLHAGSIGAYALIADGGELNTFGGSIATNLTVGSGGIANIAGGSIDDEFKVESGGIARIEAGDFLGSTDILGFAHIAGGEFGAFSAHNGSEVNISGGTYTVPFQAFGGSAIHFFGTHFAIDGNTLSELEIGVPTTIDLRDIALSGVLAMGDEFEFRLNGKRWPPFFGPRDYFPDASLVSITLVNNPGDYNGDGVVDIADFQVWEAAMLTGDLAADGNYDRLINEADRVVWQQTLGTYYGVIPEPATIRMCLFSWIAMLIHLRRRQFTEDGVHVRARTRERNLR